jgi:hypothetical protein
MPHQELLIHVPTGQEFAAAVINALGEDNQVGPVTLDIPQTTLETPARSSEDLIPLVPVPEEEVDAPAALPPVVPSYLHSPGTLLRMPIPSRCPSPATTTTTALTSDFTTTKTKEIKYRPRSIQKESFAARHRIQVGVSSLPTSESSSLVHRTRRGRPSVGPIGEEISAKFSGVPPPAPVDPRPAARRARQRKRNSNGDENYGGSEKKFKCEHCGQTFGRKEHVKRHVSGIHQQVKGRTPLDPYLCLLTYPPQRTNATSVECAVLAQTTSDNTCVPTSEMAIS